MANTTSTSIGWEGGWQAGSHKVVSKGYVNPENRQMASTGAIFTPTYHIKQLNPWQNSSVGHVVNYSWLSACQGEMEPFQDHLHTHGRLTSLRNKPQLKLPGQLSAPIPGCTVS